MLVSCTWTPLLSGDMAFSPSQARGYRRFVTVQRRNGNAPVLIVTDTTRLGRAQERISLVVSSSISESICVRQDLEAAVPLQDAGEQPKRLHVAAGWREPDRAVLPDTALVRDVRGV